jgi:hypothetical protein
MESKRSELAKSKLNRSTAKRENGYVNLQVAEQMEAKIAERERRRLEAALEQHEILKQSDVDNSDAENYGDGSFESSLTST